MDFQVSHALLAQCKTEIKQEIDSSRIENARLDERDSPLLIRLNNSKQEQSQSDESEEEKEVNHECKICCEKMEEQRKMTISKCNHTFHRDCIKDTVQSYISTNKFPMPCPQYGCQFEFNKEFIDKLFSQSHPALIKVYNKLFLTHKVNSDKKLCFCPSPDCLNIFEKQIIEETKQSDHHQLKNHQCPQCSKSICLLCMTVAHPMMTCEENYTIINSIQLSEQLVLKKGFKICPWCTRIIERSDGCNFMTCSCKKKFCYKCGDIEIEDHQCINGCVLYDRDDPVDMIQKSRQSDITDEEMKQLDWVEQQYKGRTQFDRQYLLTDLKTSPLGFDKNKPKTKEAIHFIIWSNKRKQEDQKKLATKILQGQRLERSRSPPRYMREQNDNNDERMNGVRIRERDLLIREQQIRQREINNQANQDRINQLERQIRQAEELQRQTERDMEEQLREFSRQLYDRDSDKMEQKAVSDGEILVMERQIRDYETQIFEYQSMLGLNFE